MTLLFDFKYEIPPEIKVMYQFCGLGKYVIVNGGILCYNSPKYQCAFMPLYKSIPEGKLIGDPFKHNLEIHIIDPAELREAKNKLIELIKSNPKTKGYKIKDKIYFILYKEYSNKDTNNKGTHK